MAPKCSGLWFMFLGPLYEFPESATGVTREINARHRPPLRVNKVPNVSIRSRTAMYFLKVAIISLRTLAKDNCATFRIPKAKVFSSLKVLSLSGRHELLRQLTTCVCRLCLNVNFCDIWRHRQQHIVFK